MGLFQKALETFNCNQNIVGVAQENSEILAPISHTVTRAEIKINIDKDGNYISARLINENEPKIIIPVTQESNGRTSGLSPHPLCEQLKYLAPYNEKANSMYIEQLKKWESSEFTHPIVKAVFNYISKKSIINDLFKEGYIKLSDNGKVLGEDQLVIWNVIGLQEEIESNSYLNKELFDLFIKYYNKKIERDNKNLCFIEGLNKIIAKQHTGGVVAKNGKAKLISSNDDINFTYRGRFSEDWQAVTISYEASQKAHNALRWLIANQSFTLGKRTFLCWNPQGIKIPNPRATFRNNKEPKYKPSDYKENLIATLLNFKKDNKLKGNEIAVIAFFDAATTGRLALTYYNEQTIEDFLNKQKFWEEYCCWPTKSGIVSPNLISIISCTFGTLRNGNLEVDDKIQGQQMQRLLNAKLNGGNIPIDFVKTLTERASMPLAFGGKWEQIIYTACAVLQKYRHDTNKGGNEMAWELTKQDRSFQFGRLLAVLDWAEERYYYQKQKESKQTNQNNEGLEKDEEIRQTNAIRAMHEFRRHPWHVYERLFRIVNQAYIPRIKRWERRKYEETREDIFTIIKTLPEEELNKPLDDIYLMGYELQKINFNYKQYNPSMEEQE